MAIIGEGIGKLLLLFKRFIALCILVFCFASFYKGSSSLLRNIIPFNDSGIIALFLSAGILWLIYRGYLYMAFACSEIENIIINLEYYFNILEKIKEMRINGIRDESLHGSDDINDISCFIQDYIIYKSKTYPGRKVAKLLPRVDRPNHDYYYHFKKDLVL
jgi:hypothetical protein